MARLNKKSSRRGASLKGAARKKTPENVYFRRVAPFVYATIFIGLCVGVYQLAYPLLTKPVSRVSISGELVQANKGALQNAISPYLTKGFLLADLSVIKEEIEKMPWIYQASVERHWPDQITIHVVEQTAVARWGKQSYINADGDVFSPSRPINISGLPALYGPENKSQDVMDKFKTLSGVLQKQQLVLTWLSLSDGYRWIGKLDNNVALVFGEEPVVEKIDRFIVAYRAGLKKKFNQVEGVDMRYSNGLAVKWKTSPVNKT